MRPRKLFSCSGGYVAIPDPCLVLVSRSDGGNLIVCPPREVWDRGELNPDELSRWAFLVSASATAMMEALPQLKGGCINYWDAGNWALNDRAEPAGDKSGHTHRRVHLHLLGRSKTSQSESLKWGEAPKFPDYLNRFDWAANNDVLTAAESEEIVKRAEFLLRRKYHLSNSEVFQWSTCAVCKYPQVWKFSERLCESCDVQNSAR